jgi:hypothetical protein
MERLSRRTSLPWVVLLGWFGGVVFVIDPTQLYGQNGGFEKQPISLIPAGTMAIDQTDDVWNRLILIATPNFASGYAQGLNENIRKTVSSFSLAIMAKVSRELDPQTQLPVHRLADIGVGYAFSIGGRPMIINNASAEKLGVKLDFTTRQILGENERQLTTIRTLAKTPALVIFDAPSLMHREQKHLDFVTRHFIWIETSTGKLSMLVWLIKKGENVAYSDPIKLVESGTIEDRKIHVDSSCFFLGIPTRQAFALEALPPGRAIPWKEQLRPLAGRSEFTESSLGELGQGLNSLLSEL